MSHINFLFTLKEILHQLQQHIWLTWDTLRLPSRFVGMGNILTIHHPSCLYLSQCWVWFLLCKGKQVMCGHPFLCLSVKNPFAKRTFGFKKKKKKKDVCCRKGLEMLLTKSLVFWDHRIQLSCNFRRHPVKWRVKIIQTWAVIL